MAMTLKEFREYCRETGAAEAERARIEQEAQVDQYWDRLSDLVEQYPPRSPRISGPRMRQPLDIND